MNTNDIVFDKINSSMIFYLIDTEFYSCLTHFLFDTKQTNLIRNIKCRP